VITDLRAAQFSEMKTSHFTAQGSGGFMNQIWLGMTSDELEKSRMLEELEGVCNAIFRDFARIGIPVECAGPQVV